MRHVFLYAQSVYHQRVHAAQGLHRLRRHLLAVGDVGERAKTEADDGQTGVHHPQRHDDVAVDLERVERRQLVYVEGGHTGIEMLGKAVRHAVAQVAGHVGLAPDRERHGVAVRAQVVDAADVVVVAVRNQQSVEVWRSLQQNLLPEVGAAVDEEPVAAWSRHQSRSPEPLVARVSRGAHLAPASYLRNARRRPRTKYGNCIWHNSKAHRVNYILNTDRRPSSKRRYMPLSYFHSSTMPPVEGTWVYSSGAPRARRHSSRVIS